jgi:hypothetical protein
MAISSIGSSALPNLAQASLTAMRQKTPASLLKDMDTDQSGSVSKDEFVAFGETLKADGPKASAPQGAAAPTLPSADAMFSATDTNGDSSLSVDELSSMMAQAETQRAASSGRQGGAQGAGKAGPPPGGGSPPPNGATGGAKGSAGASGSDESSSSSKTTEAADTNKDGTVSAAEKLIYGLTHPTASSQS